MGEKKKSHVISRLSISLVSGVGCRLKISNSLSLGFRGRACALAGIFYIGTPDL